MQRLLAEAAPERGPLLHEKLSVVLGLFMAGGGVIGVVEGVSVLEGLVGKKALNSLLTVGLEVAEALEGVFVELGEAGAS